MSAVLALAMGASKSFVLISYRNTTSDLHVLESLLLDVFVSLNVPLFSLSYRINKRGSQKDEEQKKSGNYFFYDDGAGDDDEEDIDDFDL